jgi:hypothetical protein
MNLKCGLKIEENVKELGGYFHDVHFPGYILFCVSLGYHSL